MLSKLKKQLPLSLTLRVILFVALTVAVCLSLMASLINSSIDHHFQQQDAGELEVIIKAIESNLNAEFTTDNQLSDQLKRAVSGHHGVYYDVRNSDGELIYKNSELNFVTVSKEAPVATQFTDENIQLWYIEDQTFRGLVTSLTVSGKTYQVITAINIDFHLHFLNQFEQSLWMIMAGSSILILLAAWLAIYQGLNPLRALSNEVADIQANKMNVRLDAGKVPVELRNLVESFNQMLDRLEDSFSRLADFSTDIAHELRTPLTNIITQTQVNLSKPRNQETYQEMLFSNLEELERLSVLINDMLRIAKVNNGLIKPDKVALNSHTEIEVLFEFFDAFAEEAGVALASTGPEIIIDADQSHLRQALSNLLSNAIRHSTKASQVIIETRVINDKQALISVINSGNPIPENVLPYLFDRFYRVDKSRNRHSEGAGLGLAIAKALIEANDGCIEVKSDVKNTRFQITIPLFIASS